MLRIVIVVHSVLGLLGDNMGKFDMLWVEKYRPHTLSDMALSDETRSAITRYAEAQDIPHLLMVNTPGVGKTTLAMIIAKDILKCQYLYINASEENGIDTVRTKIAGFAQTKSIDGNRKVVILDEAGFLTAQGQSSLRNIIETYAGTTRFIATANELHKITPAIKSRLQSLEVKFSIPQALQRCMKILKSENISLTDEDVKHVHAIVKRGFPDLRTIISNLQLMCLSGKFVYKQIEEYDTFADEVVEKLRSVADVSDIRSFVITNEHVFDSDYPQLLKAVLNSICKIDDKRKPIWVGIAAEHFYRTTFASDQEINAFHCLVNLKLQM